ncbi:hypothetical protein L211DRAFT_851177 [Terfezia boudieri ATCC MYA-4762]|uniref:Uncharacterized protein n=1 Tax=Terfezia boudieri ATCC MYA-4762 TaxID=1051890 RepID=A0A3N4LJ30_9PEZI|nr:hypothetical protein L211DRAFT_851177 [Terfezia boudieri ATCC MYA-4762]
MPERSPRYISTDKPPTLPPLRIIPPLFPSPKTCLRPEMQEPKRFERWCPGCNICQKPTMKFGNTMSEIPIDADEDAECSECGRYSECSGEDESCDECKQEYECNECKKPEESCTECGRSNCSVRISLVIQLVLTKVLPGRVKKIYRFIPYAPGAPRRNRVRATAICYSNSKGTTGVRVLR